VARLFVTLQYLLPHHLLCRIVYALSRSQRVWLKNALIRAFVRHYRADLSDALEPEPTRYQSFNAFFTRALKPNARAVDCEPAQVVCPCDGLLGQCGQLSGGQLLQAKGHHYTVAALLAAESAAPRSFEGGAFATLYLAPYHYHRVHMPLAGTLQAAWHVPGRLFSVNAATTARVPRLFARNERLVCLFNGEHGRFAVVMVGALFVGSMSTVWHGEVTPWRGAHANAGVEPGGAHRLEPLPGSQLTLERGAELGRFNMGSTVVLLLPPAGVHWNETLAFGAAVRVGQPFGALREAPAGQRAAR
jgi:phosphatidylserine decarboxylase